MYARNEKIVPIYIEDEMKDSYISYAMSVIVGRALPDVRDGLKPVHRRILYAMKELGLEHTKPYKKCARITGEVLGKYHPHGDVAVYDTLVRMVQDFSLRYPLVEGQGNFGCFTKDTKVRLTDGRALNFEELIKEAKDGKRNFTFTFNPLKKKIEIAEILKPRLTRREAKIIKVILDNREEIRCTPDHPFMLRDGTYKKAKNLKPQDSLMPLYIKPYDGRDDSNLKGYEMVYHPIRDKWEFIHHLASDFDSLVDQAKQYCNHKVVAVEFLGDKEDVFDLTIEPWHNFALASGIFVHNSVDGDAPAAMRYTEARLAAISDEMLTDLEKDTVDFMPNFDATLQEPTVLPATLPNLLVNGSSGIAVGMATNIPPHNLSEVIDGIISVIDEPDIAIKELMKIIKAPDFPTGGIICGREGIKQAYTTGRGLLKIRARAGIESHKSGKESVVITEIPYQVNKANVIESIAQLVQDKRLEGIADIRDESDKEGLRIVVELKRDANSQVIMNQLFKHTQLEVSFGVIMLALVDDRPRVLNLKQTLECYIDHRKEVVTLRTKFELKRAQERAHILEGLKKALANLDKVIETIKKSKSVPEAKEALVKKFDLTEIQAQAILEMQLQRLTALEREKIEEEYLDLIKKIELYESILKSEKKVLQIIKEELLKLKEKYGDERRTDIVGEVEELEVEDLIAEEDVVITISHSGYIKRLPVSGYRRQRRGGKGVTGAEVKEEDFVEHLFIASTHEHILFFTNQGRVHWLKVYDVPQAGRQAKGKAIINLLELQQGEAITAFVPVKEFKEGHSLIMATKQGVIKKTELSAYSRPRKGGIIGITLEKGDELIGVVPTDGKKEILLATKEGKAIRFPETQVRDMGRSAKGVKGVTLGKKDEVIGMEIVRPEATVLTVTSLGFGKRTQFKEYRTQSRGGKGIINIRVTKKNGEAIGLKTVSDKDEIMLITERGVIVRCPVKDIRTTGRAAQGVRIIKLDAKDKVASAASVVAEEEQEGEEVEEEK